MITVDEKEVLRRKVLVDGLSIREVARQNGCSRRHGEAGAAGPVTLGVSHERSPEVPGDGPLPGSD